MRNIISFFIQKPAWGNAIIIVSLIFGITAIVLLDRSFFPEQDPNKLNISIFYNGASPVEMEEGVTIKVEQALRGVQGVDEITSTSSENFSKISIVAFKDADIDEVFRDVENAVNGINSLPVGVEKPTIVKQRNFMNSRASIISLSGDVGVTLLKETAEQIEDDLLNTKAISQLLTEGYPESEFSIEVKEIQLLRYNLTFDDVVNAIKRNNKDVSAGSVKTKDEEYLIRAKSKQNTVFGIEDIALRSTVEGEKVTIGDVADVKYQFADSPIESYIDGERNVTLILMKLENDDLGDITDEIEKYIAEFNSTHTEMKLTTTFQRYDLLRQRLSMLVSNGGLGLLLVLIVLGLFLNLRLSIWVAVGIPVSFLGMFMVGAIYGITINMISLSGMILVVGIIVDDGIVIAENIYSHYEKGKSPYNATLDGTMEVLPAVFTSVITTVVAFSVLLFLEEMEQMREMAFVVIICLLFSLIEAFLVLPAHLKSKKLQKKEKIGFFGKIKNKAEGVVRFLGDKVYGDVLKFILYRKAVRRTLAFFPLIFIIIITIFLFTGVIKKTFFPAIPFDDFKVEVSYKPGEPKEKTMEYLWYCYDEVAKVQVELKEKYGRDLIQFVSIVAGKTEELGETGPHCGMIRVQLDAEGAAISSFEIAKMVEDRINKDLSLDKFMVGGGNRWGKPISIALKGKNTKEIKEAKEYLKSELRKMSELKDITDNGGEGNREIRLTLKEKAHLLGLTHGDITKQIRQGFFGEEVQRLIIGTNEIKVWVRYPKEDRGSLGQMDEVKIKTDNDQLIPLRELVDYEIKRGEVSIKHYNGVREIVVDAAQVDALASTSDFVNDIEDNILPSLGSKFKSVDYEFRGQALNARKSRKEMNTVVSILIFLMILILSLNFNSFWQGLLFLPIMLIGPFCAMLGHGLENVPFSLLSVWGVIALLGILVNDAIVFLDKYNRNLKEGLMPVDAVYNAGMKRFRPILLTSLTTIAGLYPLIREQSFQAQFLIPMAVSVAYGVFFGTLFILIFFPTLILFSNDVRKAFKWLWTGVKPSMLDVEPAIIDQRRDVENSKELKTGEERLNGNEELANTTL